MVLVELHIVVLSLRLVHHIHHSHLLLLVQVVGLFPKEA